MTPFEVLNVSPAATSAEIRTAFRDKAKILHPDKGGDVDEFRELCEAYHLLDRETESAATDLSSQMRRHLWEQQAQAAQRESAKPARRWSWRRSPSPA